MRNEYSASSDARLSKLLQSARPASPLRPGFQSAVWRRIERAQAAQEAGSGLAWLDRLAAWLLRPRWAVTGIATLVVAGGLLGAFEGVKAGTDAARDRYIASVSPLTAQP